MKNINDHLNFGEVLSQPCQKNKDKYSIVKRAYHKQTELDVAVKIVRKQDINGNKIASKVKQRQYINEIETLCCKTHHHIVHVIEFLHDSECIYIIMDYSGN